MIDTKTVFITGVSRGLGASLVKKFVEEGYSVCGLTRTENDHKQYEEKYDSEQYFGVVADISNPGDVRNAVEELVKKYGRIDVVFNNAAIYPKINFLDEPAEEFLHALLVNVGGIANVCKAVLPIMVQQKQGKIYNVGSWADINPALNSASYSASKGSIHALTKAIAADISELNLEIEVHEWIPGHLNTRMSDFTGIDPDISALWATQIVKQEATTKNCIFENNREWRPPLGIRQKIRRLFLPF
ncbi:MAG: SDR family oxidoreductase [bacterium]